MSIESSSATHSAKAAGSLAVSGKKTGKPDATKDAAPVGFSAMMSLLSASDPPQEDTAAAVVAVPDVNQVAFNPNLPLTLTDKLQAAMNFVLDSAPTLDLDTSLSGTAQAANAVPAGSGERPVVVDQNLPAAFAVKAQAAMNFESDSMLTPRAVQAANAVPTGSVERPAFIDKNLPAAHAVKAQAAINFESDSMLAPRTAQVANAVPVGSVEKPALSDQNLPVAPAVKAQAAMNFEFDSMLAPRTAQVANAVPVGSVEKSALSDQNLPVAPAVKAQAAMNFESDSMLAPRTAQVVNAVPAGLVDKSAFIDQNLPAAFAVKAQAAMNSISDTLSAEGSVAMTGLMSTSGQTQTGPSAGEMSVPGVAVSIAGTQAIPADTWAQAGKTVGTATAPSPVLSSEIPSISAPKVSAQALTGALSGDKAGLDKSGVNGVTTQVTLGLTKTATEESVQSQIDMLLGHRSAVQAQTLSATQLGLREVKSQSLAAPRLQSPDLAALLTLTGAGDLLARPQERSGSKPATGQGGSGFEGAFGATQVSQAGNDLNFEVPPAQATVPETGIAETVSHWALQGIQSAELTLDGFGSYPVEVSISLNGDQAQIDFRTDQADVRQILESAAAQLKDMLSGEGLQLTGVSVGFAGGGQAQGDGRQAKPAPRQVNFASNTAPVTGVVRNANPSVGRSLDIFV